MYRLGSSLWNLVGPANLVENKILRGRGVHKGVVRKVVPTPRLCKDFTLESGMDDSEPAPKDIRTRRAILNLLKQKGPTDSIKMAGELGFTPMAVRQHLYALQKERMVDYQEEARPLGRPAKIWKLTAEANRIFPDAHAELNLSLIDAISHTFGENGFQQLMNFRKGKQIEAYREVIAARPSLVERLQALAKARTEEGYMAEVEASVNGAFLLVENHCPICSAAKACTGLCSSELEVFRTVLGPEIQVERVEHILAGARRCAYRIQPDENHALTPQLPSS
jgi:predicted ArsR family transcriptional regulator